jgi:hypothetical protein
MRQPCGDTNPKPRDDALALLLAFGSAITYHEDFHHAPSVPYLAHTPALSRAWKLKRSVSCKASAAVRGSARTLEWALSTDSHLPLWL